MFDSNTSFLRVSPWRRALNKDSKIKGNNVKNKTVKGRIEIEIKDENNLRRCN
jgi:hypothetical protein